MNKIEETKFKFINRLIELRIDKGLTQKDISESVGLSQSLINEFESGNKELNFSDILRYLEILELNINDIFNK